MTDNVFRETVASWRGTTTLHGPNEYRSMPGIVGKIAWTVVIFAVGGFCVWQMSSLCYSYATHRKQTNVDFLTDVPLPKIAFDHPDLARMVREGALYSGLVQYGSKASLMVLNMMEDKVCPTTENFYDYYYDAAAADSSEEHDAVSEINTLMRNATEKKLTWAFPYVFVIPHGTNRSKIMQYVRSGGIDKQNGLIAEDLVQFANHYKHFLLNTTKIAKVKLAATGPKVLFEIGNHTTKSVDTVIVFVARDNWDWSLGMAELNLYFGRGAEGFGFSSSVHLPFPDTSQSIFWHLSVRFTLYERAKFYCNEDYDETMLGCVEMCMIDRAQEDPENGCVPYLGEAPRASGLPPCVAQVNGTETCLRAQQDCESMCAGCEDCQPCTEMRAQTTILWHTISDENTVSAIVLNIDGQDGVRRYATVEYYGVSDFISQVGGLLGLCFGASILSLVHLLYSCCSVLPAIVKARAERRTVEPSDNAVTDQRHYNEVKARREILGITTESRARIV